MGYTLKYNLGDKVKFRWTQKILNEEETFVRAFTLTRIELAMLEDRYGPKFGPCYSFKLDPFLVCTYGFTVSGAELVPDESGVIDIAYIKVADAKNV